MKEYRSFALILTVFIALSACGTKKEPRTKWTDPVMRVMIDPDSIDSKNYMKIVYALHETGRWIVVDRSSGFRAIKKEQEMLHRQEVDRFADREKYAHWGRLYGVGGVVVAQSTCQRLRTFGGSPYLKCTQNLAIIHANTGEILAVAEESAENESGWDEPPSWADTVFVLTENFPKHFEASKNSERLEEYKDLSKERAIRSKEEKAEEEIENDRK